jgi:hypothetical protein
MRKNLVILLLALLLLCSPRPFKASAQEQDANGASPQENPAARGIDSYTEGEDDIFSSSYERELLSRRFFQKTLPPLKPREKIAWAFKTSKAGILL